MTHCFSLWKCFMRLSGSCSPTVARILATELPFDPTEEVELGVVGLIDPVARGFRDLMLIERRRPALESPG